jgi:hypothetical protein
MDGQLQNSICSDVKRKVREENLSTVQCVEQAYNYMRKAEEQLTWTDQGYSGLWMCYAKAYMREVHRKLDGNPNSPRTFINTSFAFVGEK